MRMLSRFVMLLVLLAFCLPAQGQDGGEILIYNKTMRCFEAFGESFDEGPWEWEIDEGTCRGYLILEVDFADGEIDEIYSSLQIEYWREGRDKYYEVLRHAFDVERIEIEDRFGRPIAYWVLEDVRTPDGDVIAMMIRGKARLTNIGLGWDERKEVASVLEGAALEFQEWGSGDYDYIWKRICCATLRLHPWWTRIANLYEPGPGDPDPFEYAVEDIVMDWLEWLGYEPLIF